MSTRKSRRSWHAAKFEALLGGSISSALSLLGEETVPLVRFPKLG
jgi:hypothetical protein